MNISFERIFGTKPCNNKNYYTVLLPYKSDKIRYNIHYFETYKQLVTRFDLLISNYKGDLPKMQNYHV